MSVMPSNRRKSRKGRSLRRRGGPKQVRSRRPSRGFKRRMGRRTSRRSRVNISKAHVTTTREFIWGNFSINGNTLQFTQPDNVGGAITTTIPLITGSVALYGNGFSANFSIQDLPTAELAVIRNFNFYKLDSVTLKFKPRWNNTGQDTSVIDTTGTGVVGGGGGAPRLYLHTQHDTNKVANEAITGPDSILRYGTHTLYDLTGQRLYHIKPSTAMASANVTQAAVNPSNTGTLANTPTFGRWIDSSFGSASSASEVSYDGLQMWAEWENPPLQATATGLISTVVDVFATYTVSMKTIEA